MLASIILEVTILVHLVQCSKLEQVTLNFRSSESRPLRPGTTVTSIGLGLTGISRCLVLFSLLQLATETFSAEFLVEAAAWAS
ncbi:hypothetical protein QQP08_008567 [Theobroma cacao]|nr:hypothetical protein QQP08_008567 [Theobroma cacao]